MKKVRQNSDKNVSEANTTLVYAIGVLRGKHVVSTRKGRLHIALILREQLQDNGFWWQARILNCWIHRFQQGEFACE